ncbi:MAG TPA: calcium/sodium antiporter [Acidimicrobiales bacterium]|nr:calcium/sodium antiporter [Acidimicrobiales bacterium]
MALLIIAAVVGLVLLTLAADQFVIGAARLSVALRVSPVVIGAVVIGFGTSAPEMLVSGIAAGSGSLDIAIGNIIGSNVANLSLVLGVAALVAPLAVRSGTLKREAPISVASVVLIALIVQGGIGRTQGVILLGAMVVALTAIIVAARMSGETDDLADEVEEMMGEEPPGARLGGEAVRTLLGLIGTIGGAQLLVWSARGLAAEIGLSEAFIGLTVVAIGTSLPELVTSIQAARKGEHDLIAGNLLGSNLFNSLAVGGIAGVVGPGPIDAEIAGTGSVLMVGLALVAWLFMGTGRTVERWEGGLLLVVYVVALPFLA